MKLYTRVRPTSHLTTLLIHLLSGKIYYNTTLFLNLLKLCMMKLLTLLLWCAPYIYFMAAAIYRSLFPKHLYSMSIKNQVAIRATIETGVGVLILIAIVLLLLI